MEDTKSGHTILVRKPHMDWMTQRCGWESNNKEGLNKIEWGYELDSCNSEEKPDVGSCEHGTEPLDYTEVEDLLTIWRVSTSQQGVSYLVKPQERKTWLYVNQLLKLKIDHLLGSCHMHHLAARCSCQQMPGYWVLQNLSEKHKVDQQLWLSGGSLCQQLGCFLVAGPVE